MFQARFSRSVCIIDCSEIFIQRPTSLIARAQPYSSYKGHNTVKFFLAINPTGTIIFLSKCWGGRVSDKHLTNECGFYRKLLPGDLVLADRGFDITDELTLHLQFHHLQKARINCPRQKLKPQDSYHEYASMWNVPLGG